MKVFLISAGALLVAMAVKASIPAAMNDAPAVWSVILSWMKPPYLLIIVNGIIVTIFAASRFQEVGELEPPVRSDRHLISVRNPPPVEFLAYAAEPEVKNVVKESRSAIVLYESGDRVVELKPVMVNGSRVEGSDAEDEATVDFDSGADDESEGGLILNSTSATLERIPPEFQLEYYHPSPAEHPLPPSRRSSDRRKPRRTNSQGAEARKLAKHETFESVWKSIMEAREEQLTSNDDSPAANYVLRQQPSPSQDELNRRIEDFITKMNDEMRQQRQRSLDRHMNKFGSRSHT